MAGQYRGKFVNFIENAFVGAGYKSGRNGTRAEHCIPYGSWKHESASSDYIPTHFITFCCVFNEIYKYP
jgi:hypothetical protein